MSSLIKISPNKLRKLYNEGLKIKDVYTPRSKLTTLNFEIH